MTKNLENVLNLVDKQSDLLDLEEIQERRMRPHEKGHKAKKKRIIGLGGSKTTGAKGLKRVSDFSRSKSAPPGFGVLEEEEDKPTKKIKISIISDIEERKKRKKKKKNKKTRKKRATYWPYWGFSTDSDGSDGGGDGGGGE